MNGQFRMQLNSFTVITRKMKGWAAKRLRFTITLGVDLPPVNPELGDTAEELRMDISGNLAHVSKEGQLVWSPPQARSGAWYTNIIITSPALYERVQRAIAGSKFPQMLTQEYPPVALDPKTLDPEAPETLEA